MVNDAVLFKNFNSFPKEIYHGTSSVNYKSLNEGVNINLCNHFTDFGQGFYLTSNYIQAKKHAKKKALLKGDPLVFVYKIELPRLKREYTGYILNKMNLEWARFIYNNRSKNQNYIHHYDYSFGGVADGKIFDLVTLLDNHDIDLEFFYEEIAKYPSYDQLAIHNQALFNYNIVKLQKVVKTHDRQKRNGKTVKR